jgi:hypothetical protein
VTATSHLSVGWCGEHRKSLYPSRKTGWNAINCIDHPDANGMRPYPCEFLDGMFHIGHCKKSPGAKQYAARKAAGGAP